MNADEALVAAGLVDRCLGAVARVGGSTSPSKPEPGLTRLPASSPSAGATSSS